MVALQSIQEGREMEKKRIAVIGGGNMGMALARGILQTNWAQPDRIMIAEPLKEKLEAIRNSAKGIKTSHSNVEATTWADVILLSIKPQIMGHVLDEIKPAMKDSKLVISVAAGISTSTIEKRLGGKVPVVRAMPNIAAVVREAATAICLGSNATEQDRATAKHIFESVGMVVDVDEDLMDAVTGLSGTGPMYVFQILEGLSDAGVKVGLSRDIANSLAVQTLIGSAKLIKETKEHPAKLKDLVTSPGGTAISALHSLEKNGLKALLIDAVEVAAKRSSELGTHKKEL